MSSTEPVPVPTYLGLGSNQGDRLANLRTALTRLSRGAVVQRTSSVYETAPWGYTEQPAFLNLVCLATTALPPFDLLALVKAIEVGMGRLPTVEYGPRPIDIDILFYDTEQMLSPALTIPHPHIQDRAFVLVPLNELAPDLVHPLSGRRVQELLAETADSLPVVRWGPPLVGHSESTPNG